MATINGSSGQAGYSFWAEVSETIPSDYITYNYTYVKTVIKIKNGGSRTDTNGWTLVVNVNGSEVFKDTNYRLNTYNGGSAGYYDEFTLATINNIRIPHETNGSKTITVSAELYKSSYASYDPGHCYIPASGVSNRIQLTTIPRYTSITSFDVSKIDETSIRVTWDAANTCDRVRYSLNNGSWVTLSTFSKNFVIDNLTANTQYSVKISVRRSDSQLDTNSDPKSVTTYAYPSIRSNGVPSFVIGNDFNILLDNPLGRTCNVTLIGDNNSEKAALATTGTTINGFNASEWITFFNNSLPSSVEGNYKIRLVCSTGNINIESSTSKYYINTNDTTYKPIFTDQNIINVQNSGAYASISGTDKFIKNHNNLVGQIVKMTPQKGSNGNYYEISATGIVTQRKTYSNDNISFSLENISSSNFAITAYDSRSIFYTKVEKSINLIDYNNPTINSNSVNITRQNIIGDKAIIDISGGYTDWENLLEDNTIQSIKYRVGDSGAFNNLPSGSDIDIGNGDWSVYTTLEDTFDVRSSYNLYFQVTDLLETVVFGPYVLSTADAFIWKDLQNRYIGINKKPTCELDINGAAKFSKTSRNYNDGALVGAKEVSATTMSNIISELRYTNGQIGSFNLQTAYTLNSITIPTGWYNYTWMPHRFGGNSGQATSDNCNYGTLFMTGMNTQNGPYIVHFINQQIDSIQDLQSSGGGGGYQSLPLGSIVQYTSVTNVPEGWMTCDGSAISRTEYSDLFALIGTTYGTGDGSTTFNLPDLRSRAVFGYDSSDTDFNSLNKKGGDKTHTHDLSNHTHTSAAHDHTLSRKGYAKINLSNQTSRIYVEAITDIPGWSDWWYMATSGTAKDTSGTSYRGVVLGGKTDSKKPENTGGPSNNTSGSGSSLPKYITLNYIIKVENTTPLVGSVVDNLDGESTTNAPSVRAVKEALENGGGGGGGVDAAPVGTLSPFVGDAAPSGYLFCQGQLVDKAIYPELYAICGNTFGTATSTQFYLPDLRGRVIAGYKSGDAEFGTLGGLIGSKYLQEHSHFQSLSDSGDRVGVASYSWAITNTGRWYNGADLAGVVNGVQTGNAGNIQPTIVLNWMVKAKPTVLLEKLPLGTILEYPFTTNVPDGWHLCDGSAISRTTYAELFALIGTTFGTGDGSTTFNLPNKKGRVSVGIDSNDTDFNAIGKTGGSKSMQSHYHDLRFSDPVVGSGVTISTSGSGLKALNISNWDWNYNGSNLKGSASNLYTSVEGSGNSGNLQPYIVTNYIIKISQVTTLIGEVVNDMTSDSTTNAPSIHAVNESLWTSGRTDLTDCNDMLKDGVYGWSGTTANTPVANSWGTLLTLNNWLINGRNDNTTVQLGVISDSNDERVYFRERYGSSGWSTWKSIYGKKAREMVDFYSMSNRTTSSTTDVDISGASKTLTTYGGDLLITTTISANVTGNMGFISLYIDDTLIEEVLCLNSAVSNQSFTVNSIVTGISAGSHTIKLKMKVQKNTNVLTINNYNTNKFTIVEL